MRVVVWALGRQRQSASGAGSLEFPTKMPRARRPRHTFCDAWAGASAVIKRVRPCVQILNIARDVTMFFARVNNGICDAQH